MVPMVLHLQGLLETLECDTSTDDDLLDTYCKLSAILAPQDCGVSYSGLVKERYNILTVSKIHVEKSFRNDSPGVVVAQKALCVLGYCLSDQGIISLMPNSDASSVLDLLADIIRCSTEKTTCSLAFWCLSKQRFESETISSKLDTILTATQTAACRWWSKSVMVELQGLKAISRLYTQCMQAMEVCCSVWGPIVLRLLVSAAPKVCTQALDEIKMYESAFVRSKDCIKACTGVLSYYLKPELEKMFRAGKCAHTLDVCVVLLPVFKQELKHASIINSLMKVVELAFCCKSTDIRCHAFVVWRRFIDVFYDTDLLMDPKYISLVMQVFCTRNADVLSVALEKMNTWWHYVRCFGLHIWIHRFDQILKPLLIFCLANPRLGVTPLAFVSAAHTAASTVHGSPAPSPSSSDKCQENGGLPKFEKLQMLGLQVLARLLKIPNEEPCESINFSIEPLDIDTTLPGAVFLKSAAVFVAALCECSAAADAGSSGLVQYTWQCLMWHMVAGLESERKERYDAVSTLLSGFMELVQSGVLSASFLLELFQFICTLPDKILSSPVYSDGCQANNLIKGSPALFLCELLLTPIFLKEDSCHERLLGCSAGQDSAALPFFHYLGNILTENAVSCLSQSFLWRLWNGLACGLIDNVKTTNEVNDGDVQDHNFDCMYTILLFPLVQRFAVRLDQESRNGCLKTWTELYRTFARLAALVPCAEANIVLGEFSSEILRVVESEGFVMDAQTIKMLTEMMYVIAQHVDYSSLTSANSFILGHTVSPDRRRQHTVLAGNLQKFVLLLTEVLVWMNSPGNLSSAVRKEDDQDECCHMISAWSMLTDTICHLIQHLHAPGLIRHVLEASAAPLGDLLQKSSQKCPPSLFTASLLQKVDVLWEEICRVICDHYPDTFDSRCLSWLSLLLVPAFQHSRYSIRRHTASLWSATFGISSTTFPLPSKLRQVFSEQKWKTMVTLEETCHQNTAGLGDAHTCQTAQQGLSSPRRLRGRLLDRGLFPKKASPSPVKCVRTHSKNGGSARRHLSVDSLSEKEFVVIPSKATTRLVLTEHQREILKKKKLIPALYNSLDASQDTSSMTDYFACSDTERSNQPSVSGHSSVQSCRLSPNQSVEVRAHGKAALRRSSRLSCLNFKVCQTDSNSGTARQSNAKFCHTACALKQPDEHRQCTVGDPAEVGEPWECFEVPRLIVHFNSGGSENMVSGSVMPGATGVVDDGGNAFFRPFKSVGHAAGTAIGIPSDDLQQSAPLSRIEQIPDSVDLSSSYANSPWCLSLSNQSESKIDDSHRGISILQIDDIGRMSCRELSQDQCVVHSLGDIQDPVLSLDNRIASIDNPAISTDASLETVPTISKVISSSGDDDFNSFKSYSCNSEVDGDVEDSLLLIQHQFCDAASDDLSVSFNLDSVVGRSCLDQRLPPALFAAQCNKSSSQACIPQNGATLSMMSVKNDHSVCASSCSDFSTRGDVLLAVDSSSVHKDDKQQKSLFETGRFCANAFSVVLTSDTSAQKTTFTSEDNKGLNSVTQLVGSQGPQLSVSDLRPLSVDPPHEVINGNAVGEGRVDGRPNTHCVQDRPCVDDFPPLREHCNNFHSPVNDGFHGEVTAVRSLFRPHYQSRISIDTPGHALKNITLLSMPDDEKKCDVCDQVQENLITKNMCGDGERGCSDTCAEVVYTCCESEREIGESECGNSDCRLTDLGNGFSKDRADCDTPVIVTCVFGRMENCDGGVGDIPVVSTNGQDTYDVHFQPTGVPSAAGQGRSSRRKQDCPKKKTSPEALRRTPRRRRRKSSLSCACCSSSSKGSRHSLMRCMTKVDNQVVSTPMPSIDNNATLLADAKKMGSFPMSGDCIDQTDCIASQPASIGAQSHLLSANGATGKSCRDLLETQRELKSDGHLPPRHSTTKQKRAVARKRGAMCSKSSVAKITVSDTDMGCGYLGHIAHESESDSDNTPLAQLIIKHKLGAVATVISPPSSGFVASKETDLFGCNFSQQNRSVENPLMLDRCSQSDKEVGIVLSKDSPDRPSVKEKFSKRCVTTTTGKYSAYSPPALHLRRRKIADPLRAQKVVNVKKGRKMACGTDPCAGLSVACVTANPVKLASTSSGIRKSKLSRQFVHRYTARIPMRPGLEERAGSIRPVLRRRIGSSLSTNQFRPSRPVLRSDSCSWKAFLDFECRALHGTYCTRLRQRRHCGVVGLHARGRRLQSTKKKRLKFVSVEQNAGSERAVDRDRLISDLGILHLPSTSYGTLGECCSEPILSAAYLPITSVIEERNGQDKYDSGHVDVENACDKTGTLKTVDPSRLFVNGHLIAECFVPLHDDCISSLLSGNAFYHLGNDRDSSVEVSECDAGILKTVKARLIHVKEDAVVTQSFCQTTAASDRIGVGDDTSTTGTSDVATVVGDSLVDTSCIINRADSDTCNISDFGIVYTEIVEPVAVKGTRPLCSATIDTPDSWHRNSEFSDTASCLPVFPFSSTTIECEEHVSTTRIVDDAGKTAGLSGSCTARDPGLSCKDGIDVDEVTSHEYIAGNSITNIEMDKSSSCVSEMSGSKCISSNCNVGNDEFSVLHKVHYDQSADVKSILQDEKSSEVNLFPHESISHCGKSSDVEAIDFRCNSMPTDESTGGDPENYSVGVSDVVSTTCIADLSQHYCSEVNIDNSSGVNIDCEHSTGDSHSELERCDTTSLSWCDSASQTDLEDIRKYSKTEILGIIARSDVSSREIIAALKYKVPSRRRLFHNSRHDRGMQMLQTSLRLKLLGKNVLHYQSLPPSPMKTSAAEKIPDVIFPSCGSPVAGILKKRSAEESTLIDTSSPVSTPKKHHVSFAEPVISGESPAHEATLNKILHFKSSGRLQKCDNLDSSSVSLRTNDVIHCNGHHLCEKASEPTPVPVISCMHSGISQHPTQLQDVPVQHSCEGTRESEQYTGGAVFPDLVNCDNDVDVLLPQLSSPAWQRTIFRLVKSRGITTIGHLASLSSEDLQTIPFRPPKVDNVRTVLSKYQSVNMPAGVTVLTSGPHYSLVSMVEDGNPAGSEA